VAASCWSARSRSTPRPSGSLSSRTVRSSSRPGGTIRPRGGNTFVTARFNANGTADTTFGNGGSVAIHVSTDNVGGVTIDASGGILVAGYDSGVGALGEFYLLRYAANGTLDAGFGSGGVATVMNPAGGK